MSRLYLIDSSAWIFTLGSETVPAIRKRVEYLVEQNLAATTSPILFELLSGARTRADTEQLLNYLSALHPFPVIPEEWIEAALWTQSVRSKGVKVRTIDALIAFKAAKHRLVLIHADKDLDRVSKRMNLQVESYVDVARHATKSK